MPNYQIVKFKENNIEMDVNVSPNEDTVWLSKDDMSILFQRDRSVITRHIANIYKEGEVEKTTSCAKNAHEINGQIHYTEYYNLDVIISVGYRVKSKNGVIFRRWANTILKEYLLKGYVINEKRTLITNENYINLINKVESIDKRLTLLETTNLEKEKIFFDGEIFDAKSFITQLISKASNSIVLIDAYADIKALEFFKCKHTGVSLMIYHSSKAKLSNQDVVDFNSQYGLCTAYVNDKFHDRFLVIDDKDLYHLGASLNYAGKRVFALTKMEDEKILESIKRNL
ncbi:MAG: virulence RhuM family protein [Paludibacteraceae bacterium]|nr:virulence RhuM family protein [Paludibacteraceae bacterium]